MVVEDVLVAAGRGAKRSAVRWYAWNREQGEKPNRRVNDPQRPEPPEPPKC